MFLKKLCKLDQEALLMHAVVLACSEAEALWDGKTFDELTSNDRFATLELSDKGPIFDCLVSMILECLPDADSSVSYYFDQFSIDDVKGALEEILGELPLGQVNDSVARLKAIEIFQKILFNGGESEDVEEDLIFFKSPESAKIALFELFNLAMSEGAVSDLKKTYITSFAEYYKVEDFIQKDIFELASEINAQIGKAISLILE